MKVLVFPPQVLWKAYQKKLNKYQYLPCSFCHPRHQKQTFNVGELKSYMLRESSPSGFIKLWQMFYECAYWLEVILDISFWHVFLSSLIPKETISYMQSMAAIKILKSILLWNLSFLPIRSHCIKEMFWNKSCIQSFLIILSFLQFYVSPWFVKWKVRIFDPF